jgi:hypothetical protein
VALVVAVDLHLGHRLGVAEGAVRPLLVVEAEDAFQAGVGLDLGLVAPEVDSSYLTVRQSRSTKTLSRQRPLPSIESFTPSANSGWVNSAEVN